MKKTYIGIGIALMVLIVCSQSMLAVSIDMQADETVEQVAIDDQLIIDSPIGGEGEDCMGIGSIHVTAQMTQTCPPYEVFPIQSASTSIMGPVYRSKLTDLSGHANFYLLPLGTYHIHCYKPGKGSRDAVVTLTQSNPSKSVVLEFGDGGGGGSSFIFDYVEQAQQGQGYTTE